MMWTTNFSRPADVRALRHHVVDQLHGEGVAAADDVTLMVSELVTNALVHATDPRSLAIEVTPEAVIVEVSDGSHVVPVVRAVDPNRLGGNGMRIVHELSSAWGVDVTSAGKTVWFRQDRGDS